MSPEPNAFLCELDRAEAVTAVARALTAAGIPYQTGLQATPDGARVAIFVPWHRLGDARGVVAAHLNPVAAVDLDDEGEDTERRPWLPVPAFPWGPLQAVASVVLLHLGLVFWAGSPMAFSPNLVRSGGIVGELAVQEPWRVLTAMFIHVDPSHALWNGVSMLVFAIPLITAFGYLRTSLIYLAAGLGGGITAYLTIDPGSVVVGSSGAVAGLFGAWVVQAWRQAARDSISWRGRVRSVGIALLVLPSLVSPVNASGRPVSVSSHLGGLVTGVLVGAVISRRLITIEESGPHPEDDPLN